jgi:hypothetical protein
MLNLPRSNLHTVLHLTLSYAENSRLNRDDIYVFSDDTCTEAFIINSYLQSASQLAGQVCRVSCLTCVPSVVACMSVNQCKSLPLCNPQVRNLLLNLTGSVLLALHLCVPLHSGMYI